MICMPIANSDFINIIMKYVYITTSRKYSSETCERMANLITETLKCCGKKESNMKQSFLSLTKCIF